MERGASTCCDPRRTVRVNVVVRASAGVATGTPLSTGPMPSMLAPSPLNTAVSWVLSPTWTTLATEVKLSISGGADGEPESTAGDDDPQPAARSRPSAIAPPRLPPCRFSAVKRTPFSWIAPHVDVCPLHARPSRRWLGRSQAKQYAPGPWRLRRIDSLPVGSSPHYPRGRRQGRPRWARQTGAPLPTVVAGGAKGGVAPGGTDDYLPAACAPPTTAGCCWGSCAWAR